MMKWVVCVRRIGGPLFGGVYVLLGAWKQVTSSTWNDCNWLGHGMAWLARQIGLDLTSISHPPLPPQKNKKSNGISTYVQVERGRERKWLYMSVSLINPVWILIFYKVGTHVHDNIRNLITWECKEHGVKIVNVLANLKGSVGRWNLNVWRLEQFYTKFWSKGVVDTYSKP